MGLNVTSAHVRAKLARLGNRQSRESRLVARCSASISDINNIAAIMSRKRCRDLFEDNLYYY